MLNLQPSDLHQGVRIASREGSSNEERASRDLVRLIVNRGFRFLDGSSNLSCYNCSDERPRLIFFNKMNRRPLRCCHVSPSLK